jgi:hypothetical protein
MLKTSGEIPLSSTFQDDTREAETRRLFDLGSVPGRSSTDAILELPDGTIVEFELKSTSDSKMSVTTVRDFGPDHVQKWRTKHWIFSFYRKGDADAIFHLYASPDMMSPWINEKWDYVKNDFAAAQIIPDDVTSEQMFKVLPRKDRYSLQDAKALHKRQWTDAEYLDFMDIDDGYSTAKMLEIYRHRVRYLLARGSTLNNPHIPGSYFRNWDTRITGNHAAELRTYVGNYLSKKR